MPILPVSYAGRRGTWPHVHDRGAPPCYLCCLCFALLTTLHTGRQAPPSRPRASSPSTPQDRTTGASPSSVHLVFWMYIRFSFKIRAHTPFRGRVRYLLRSARGSFELYACILFQRYILAIQSTDLHSWQPRSRRCGPGRRHLRHLRIVQQALLSTRVQFFTPPENPATNRKTWSHASLH